MALAGGKAAGSALLHTHGTEAALRLGGPCVRRRWRSAVAIGLRHLRFFWGAATVGKKDSVFSAVGRLQWQVCREVLWLTGRAGGRRGRVVRGWGREEQLRRIGGDSPQAHARSVSFLHTQRNLRLQSRSDRSHSQSLQGTQHYSTHERSPRVTAAAWTRARLHVLARTCKRARARAHTHAHACACTHTSIHTQALLNRVGKRECDTGM
jgi:hypothetical protein